MNKLPETDTAQVILNLDTEIRRKERELEALRASRSRHEQILLDEWLPLAKHHDARRGGTVYLKGEPVFSIRASQEKRLGQALKVLGRDDMVEVQWSVNREKLKAWMKGLIERDDDGNLDISKVPEEILRIVSVTDKISAVSRLK